MTGQNNRIILVDDNEVIRVALRALLRQAGFDVVGEARSGEGVCELVETLKARLVCLDVMMPGRSGLDVLEELRAKHPKVKVLMVTGQTDRDSVAEMIRKGAAGIVVKPFNAARVIEMVQRALG